MKNGWEELVSIDNIDVRVEAEDWKDAIRKAGQLLLDKGDIESAYIEDMIASIETLGPYIVITKGFALAHAAPCEAVKNNAVSLINLKNEINFGSQNDPVRVVMCLACVDKESHIGKLSKIAMKLMEKDMIEKLANCDSKEELYKTINAVKEEA
ncbi:MAG: PTS sugar transporter subunit IIA [Erysipelotrichaceae bacterium]|nr:PTS sugar transporter subunit IIA [Erysipelotrichaceae bacterium]